jgi:predicted nucleic acid-binding protein
MQIILDTNIVIDALASRVPFNEDAEKIILHAAARRINAAITASTASDIYYLTRKYLKNEEQTIAAMKKLFAIVDIIAVDRMDCMNAFNTGITDYEDSLLYVCAKKRESACIVTRNTNDFKKSNIPILTSSEFVNNFL